MLLWPRHPHGQQFRPFSYSEGRDDFSVVAFKKGRQHSRGCQGGKLNLRPGNAAISIAGRTVLIPQGSIAKGLSQVWPVLPPPSFLPFQNLRWFTRSSKAFGRHRGYRRGNDGRPKTLQG
ncbi:MAG: hypothetical protein JWM99_3836 [Verrucomicrobiales bacterium]|nr:hypothetical protein [Verrucomicrobiales bacterium]